MTTYYDESGKWEFVSASPNNKTYEGTCFYAHSKTVGDAFEIKAQIFQMSGESQWRVFINTITPPPDIEYGSGYFSQWYEFWELKIEGVFHAFREEFPTEPGSQAQSFLDYLLKNSEQHIKAYEEQLAGIEHEIKKHLPYKRLPILEWSQIIHLPEGDVSVDVSAGGVFKMKCQAWTYKGRLYRWDASLHKHYSGLSLNHLWTYDANEDQKPTTKDISTVLKKRVIALANSIAEKNVLPYMKKEEKNTQYQLDSKMRDRASLLQKIAKEKRSIERRLEPDG